LGGEHLQQTLDLPMCNRWTRPIGRDANTICLYPGFYKIPSLWQRSSFCGM